MKKLIFYFIVLLIISVFFGFEINKYSEKLTQYTKGKVLINKEISFNVTLAKTEAEQIKGLSGVEYLPAQSGMLFLFPEERKHSFWMKDMKFPIDILWINNNKIVQISQNIPIPTLEQAEDDKLIPTYSSDTNIDAVLELNAGISEKYQIKVGDTINYLLTK